MPDPAVEQRHLAKAEIDIAESEMRITNQTLLIERMRRDGYDATQAEKLLRTMRKTLAGGSRSQSLVRGWMLSGQLRRGGSWMNYAINGHAEHHWLLRKLDSIAQISDEDRQAILGLPTTVKVFEADTDIIRDGATSSECCLVLDGFVCRYKILADGRRQIMGFYIPGDMPDLQGLYVPTMDNSIGTLKRTTVALIPHKSMREMLRRCHNLVEILWRDTLIDAAMFREWMIGIGRRSAYQRLAHLLCELHLRMKAVGLGRENGYDLPVTQNELGDALGLSMVHVNRVLQDLRSEGLIVLRGGCLSIPNWAALQEAAEFDPTYLQLKGDSIR